MNLPTLEQLEQDPYSALGVRKFINATCHHTNMGGTLIPETTLKAMRIGGGKFRRFAGASESHGAHHC